MEIQKEAFTTLSMSVSWACPATPMARPASAAEGAAWGTAQGPRRSVPQPVSQPRSQKQFLRAQAAAPAHCGEARGKPSSFYVHGVGS